MAQLIAPFVYLIAFIGTALALYCVYVKFVSRKEREDGDYVCFARDIFQIFAAGGTLALAVSITVNIVMINQIVRNHANQDARQFRQLNADTDQILNFTSELHANFVDPSSQLGNGASAPIDSAALIETRAAALENQRLLTLLLENQGDTPSVVITPLAQRMRELAESGVSGDVTAQVQPIIGTLDTELIDVSISNGETRLVCRGTGTPVQPYFCVLRP